MTPPNTGALAVLESGASRGESGDTLKYWYCQAPGCDHRHAFLSTAIFHQHEAHGVPCPGMGVSDNRIVLAKQDQKQGA